jgi:hypothetical protein
MQFKITITDILIKPYSLMIYVIIIKGIQIKFERYVRIFR